ncbi:hypothetical protein AKJ09_05453 [Labilithrix luteola]|uniref:PPM-type phosphatase domain-containing protein n=1 Tax=Labilithrix luteola TaxID=1391654 RepID=A0A0K1Q072_9BACT|nr:hypothetical protein [Labilithrix luteola]AKU98789.1 hypothetical protein AKJ09_05453 [Labilithrix luteola]
MSFFVSRAVAPASSPQTCQDRADVFARGDVAVLAVADGAGGLGDGAKAADVVLERVRDAVLDTTFDLLSVARWRELLADTDRELEGIGETTAVVVVLADGMSICAAAGDSEAWLVGASSVTKLTANADRRRLGSGLARPTSTAHPAHPALRERLVVATDGLFRHVAEARILEIANAEPVLRAANALAESTRLPSGERPDDVAVLVAEPQERG